MAQISFTADVIAFAIHTFKAKVTHSIRPLKVILGPNAARSSANTVSLAYIRADGVHRGLRDEGYKLCTLVIIGVTARGKKRFLALEDEVRPPRVGERFCLTSNALV